VQPPIPSGRRRTEGTFRRIQVRLRNQRSTESILLRRPADAIIPVSTMRMGEARGAAAEKKYDSGAFRSQPTRSRSPMRAWEHNPGHYGARHSLARGLEGTSRPKAVPGPRSGRGHITCSRRSAVVRKLIFGCGAGRSTRALAGHVVTPEVVEALENRPGAGGPLVMVLGHSDCSAVRWSGSTEGIPVRSCSTVRWAIRALFPGGETGGRRSSRTCESGSASCAIACGSAVVEGGIYDVATGRCAACWSSPSYLLNVLLLGSGTLRTQRIQRRERE